MGGVSPCSFDCLNDRNNEKSSTTEHSFKLRINDYIIINSYAILLVLLIIKISTSNCLLFFFGKLSCDLVLD